MGIKRLRWLLRLLPLLLVLLSPALAKAQYLPVSGWCEDGNIPIVVSGLDSTNPAQASYPQCSVTVVIHGGGAATIYSDSTGTPLANPFTAATNGQWQFFTAAGTYDVTISGGTPALPGPVTFSYLTVSTGTGSVTSFSAGTLPPLFTTSVANPTTTPALSFSLSTAAADTVLGNCTGSTAAPTYCSLTNAMLPAPGSNTQMIYNSSGLFAATTGLTWDNTNRRASLVNGANNAFLSLQPGTISFASGGGVNTPRISDVFSEFDFLSGPSDDILISQSGASHLFLPGNNTGLVEVGSGGSPGALELNDGTTMSSIQGPTLLTTVGAPESSITARIGSLYLRSDGSATTSAYLKESGTSNTGWQQFAMQDDTQLLTNKSLGDTTTYIVNTAAVTKRANFNLAGATAATVATLTFAQTSSRAYTFPDATGTVCLTTTSCSPLLYDHSGNLQALAHEVTDTCVLGTSCAVTLTGASVFTNSTSYTCIAQDETAAAATKVVQSSGSAFTITGTGTDTLRYICSGI